MELSRKKRIGENHGKSRNLGLRRTEKSKPLDNWNAWRRTENLTVLLRTNTNRVCQKPAKRLTGKRRRTLSHIANRRILPSLRRHINGQSRKQRNHHKTKPNTRHTTRNTPQNHKLYTTTQKFHHTHPNLNTTNKNNKIKQHLTPFAI